ncbi:PREDICTED: uncharacterized protein LOC104587766 [Nelumbo nucifera]|uniref:Uncharacterized protein LOC104587766 n=2 Tax=Nelumbo nucifera TaxID=4432 RepID=A0A1U7Z836_NELNU|nr:PREDICTED: uncharacterized protein LOC104587766 [Nelumbo nucifera]DAD31983.1 TPA_asm: hypothetical protein HUJ06_010834 [Nelumbo nucifera]
MGSLRPKLFVITSALAILSLLLTTSLASITAIPLGDEGVTRWSSRCQGNPRKLVPGYKSGVACRSRQNVSGIKADWLFQILREGLPPAPPSPKTNTPPVQMNGSPAQ